MIERSTTKTKQLVRNLFTRTHLLLPIVLFSGCGGGDDESTECEEIVKVLPSEESVSALLGESGTELLAAVDASVTDIVNYSDNETVLTQEPTGGTSDITISIAYSDGEIREIESIARYGKEEIALNCNSRLEMDVTVEVETADGALQESWPAVLYREEGSDPVLTAGFDPNATFNGSFRIVSYNDPSDPEEVTGEFINYYHEDTADNNGRLQIGMTFRTGDGPVGNTTYDALIW